jgi:hypothetical protein
MYCILSRMIRICMARVALTKNYVTMLHAWLDGTANGFGLRLSTGQVSLTRTSDQNNLETPFSLSGIPPKKTVQVTTERCSTPEFKLRKAW